MHDAIYTYIDDARIFYGKIPTTGFYGLPFDLRPSSYSLWSVMNLDLVPKSFKIPLDAHHDNDLRFCALVTARVIYGALVAPESHLR